MPANGSPTNPRPVTFSAVIPAYNEEQYVGRAIRSVLAQTYPPIEVVVVDDGSTDRTAEVAGGFGAPVRCVSQENSGLSAARNTGIREARGEYVALLDADDEWLPQHLERAAAVLTAHPDLHWFFAGFERREESGELDFCRAYSGPLVDDAYIEDYFPAQAWHEFANSSVVVLRRQMVLELGGFDERIRKYGEDRNMWFRIALRHPRVGYSRAVGGIYWRRAGSLMANWTSPESERFLGFVRNMDRTAAEAGPDAARRSEPLLVEWFDELIRRAIEENNQDVLAQVRKDYGKRLRPFDRLVVTICRFVPNALVKAGAVVVSAVKRCLRRLRLLR